MNLRVVCIGEAMVELSLGKSNDPNAQVGFAGDTLNTAIYLKRAAPQLQIEYATKLGTDAFSERMINMMRDEDLGVDLIKRDDAREPGLYAITTDDHGERSFSYWRSASAATQMLSGHSIDLDEMMRADVVYASAISVAILPSEDRARFLDWVKSYRAQGGRFAFDSNYRPRLWENQTQAQDTIKAFWNQADIGLPSVDDEQAIYGDADSEAVIARLNNWGVRSGALKRGSQGPAALDGSAAPDCQPADKVVDSTAAGDSFNAGYLGALLTGAEHSDCLCAGHEMAKKVIGHRGALLPRSDKKQA
ncbi:MAG: sugar kinase [Paracoccaceae bacterium]